MLVRSRFRRTGLISSQGAFRRRFSNIANVTFFCVSKRAPTNAWWKQSRSCRSLHPQQKLAIWLANPSRQQSLPLPQPLLPPLPFNVTTKVHKSDVKTPNLIRGRACRGRESTLEMYESVNTLSKACILSLLRQCVFRYEAAAKLTWVLHRIECWDNLSSERLTSANMLSL